MEGGAVGLSGGRHAPMGTGMQLLRLRRKRRRLLVTANWSSKAENPTISLACVKNPGGEVA